MMDSRFSRKSTSDVGAGDDSDVVIDTGWRVVSGVRVRMTVTGGPASEIRHRWFEKMLYLTAEEDRAA